MSTRRPALTRGYTFPIHTSSSTANSTYSSLASLNIHTIEDPRSSISPRTISFFTPLAPSAFPNILFSSPIPATALATAPAPDSASQLQQQLQPQDSLHPTPLDCSTSTSMSQTTTPQSPHHHHHHHHHSNSSYFPPYSSSSSSSRFRTPSASSSPAVSPGIPLTTGRTTSTTTYAPSATLPMITSPPPNLNAAFRGHSDPRQRSNVAMSIDSTPSHYVLMAPLGHGFSADSITIAARKENTLVIIADRWDQEQDCHNEWQVQFGRDSDMSNIHANFDDGVLKITVKRFTPTHP